MSLLLSALVIIILPSRIISQCTGMDHPSCPSWISLARFCTNAGYSLERRKQFCGVRCGLCNLDGSQTAAGGGSSLVACTDRNSNCASWASNGFCSNPVMSTGLKLYNCCATCRPAVLGALSSTTTTAAATGSTTTTTASGSTSSTTTTTATATTTTTTTTVAPGK